MGGVGGIYGVGNATVDVVYDKFSGVASLYPVGVDADMDDEPVMMVRSGL